MDRVHGPGPWGGPWTRSIWWSMDPGPCFVYVRILLTFWQIIFVVKPTAITLSPLSNKSSLLCASMQVVASFKWWETPLVLKSRVSRVVTNVSLALVARQQEFVKWPKQQQELSSLKTAFYQRGGFPSVIGCVDGTHIRIQAPNKNENSYVNRKGFHSINVQGICNQEGNRSFQNYFLHLGRLLHFKITSYYLHVTHSQLYPSLQVRLLNSSRG